MCCGPVLQAPSAVTSHHDRLQLRVVNQERHFFKWLLSKVFIFFYHRMEQVSKMIHNSFFYQRSIFFPLPTNTSFHALHINPSNGTAGVPPTTCRGNHSASFLLLLCTLIFPPKHAGVHQHCMSSTIMCLNRLHFKGQRGEWGGWEELGSGRGRPFCSP